VHEHFAIVEIEVLMHSTSCSLSNGIEAMLTVFLRSERLEDHRSRVVDEAVREYLSKRGYVPPRGPLRIAPWPHPSGDSFASVEHDRVLAEPDPR
jgi:hypothetical protein